MRISIFPLLLLAAALVAAPGDWQDPSRARADGKRAVSIPIHGASGIAHFVAAGDRIDILMTRERNGQLISSVIVEDVLVLGVSQSASPTQGRPRIGATVTVELDLVQTQKLMLARQVGTLSIALRATDSPSPVKREIWDGSVPPGFLAPEIRWPNRRDYNDFPIHPLLVPPPEAW